MIIKIPKHHPLLPYSANVMLRDCRAILARELRRRRKIRRINNEHNRSNQAFVTDLQKQKV
jgi:hypothetical protein